tara:strand:+ start:32197 stop:32643 length:447 start_codon:yes stop_codon:yes gene_type:complete
MLENKNINALNCDCEPANGVWSSSDLMKLRKITRQNCCDASGCDVLPFNKADLQVNLITKSYQANIIVLEKKTDPGKPAKIDPQLTPIFAFYNLDPENKLVGDKPCGIQKYINYMILDTNAFVDNGCPNDNSNNPSGPPYSETCLCKP